MRPAHFRVFLSSPGDVHDERALAFRVIEALPKQPFIRNRATIEVVAWDDREALTPVYANLTPQRALQQHLKMPSACDIVVVILWSRLGTPLPDNDFYRKPDGGRYLSGTEWEFEDATRMSRPVLLYRRTETPIMAVDDPEGKAKTAQYESVKRFFERFKNSDGSLNGLYRDYNKPSDFERLLDGDLRSVLERLLDTRPAEPDPPPPEVMSIDAGQAPYPGLRRLGEEDAAVFFGRGAEVDALIKIIAGGNRFISVVGASGSGKSSLVRAGLLPRLRGNAVAGSKDWKFAVCAPADLGDNPFLALAAVMSPFATSARPFDLAKAMAADADAAVRFCEAALSAAPEWAKVALVIDQLEELFTISAPTYRDGFVRTIDALAAHPQVVVISTLRADFVAEATNSARLVDLLRNGSYLLMPPGMKALSDIIALPALRSNLTIQPGLLERIIEEVGPQIGTLPLLAYTLEQLFNAGRQTRTLSLHAYEALGGIRGAISKRAEDSLRSLEPAAIAALPALFRQLLTINAAGIVTRRRARQRDILTNPTTVTLVRTLIEARLLIADSRDGESTIEVAHEALFDGWDQLRSWIADNREYLLWRNRLRLRLEDWNASGRDENGALRGNALQEALRWLQQHSDDLSEEERAFIQWPLSDEFQMRGVIRSARELLASAGDRLVVGAHREWVTALIVAGDVAEVGSLLGSSLVQESVLAEARTASVSILATVGELDRALAITSEMTGTARAQAASDLLAIAAASGRSDLAAKAVTLVGDNDLTARARARAMARDGASGSSRQLTVESLSHILASQSGTNPSADGASGNVDWSTSLAQARTTGSGVLRVATLTSGIHASDEADRSQMMSAFLSELTACLDGWDEPFWCGLASVRSADSLAAVGALSEAEELATRISSRGHRGYARVLLAGHRLLRQDFARATALCELALDDISASGMLTPALEHVIDVAARLGTSGQPDHGTRLAQRALACAEQAGAVSTTVVVQVAQALGLCGAVDDAVQLLGRNIFAVGRAEAFRSVARALARQGHFDRIMVLAHLRTSPLEQADVLASVGEVDVKGVMTGEERVAAAFLQAIVQSAERRRWYSQCLIRAASMLIRNGQMAALLDALRAVEGKHEQAEASITVMDRLVTQGHTEATLGLVDEVFALIESLDDHDQRARSFARLAGIIARCGRLEEAHRTARRCHLVDHQLAALTDILRSTIVRNRFSRAAELFWPPAESDLPLQTLSLGQIM
jgi:hypothetical protein